MEIKRPEITDEVVARINKWCQTKLTKSIIPKCFGDPLLRSGLCNPGYPVPKDPTPEVPKPMLCGCYHICAIHLAEFLEIGNPEEKRYEKLIEECIQKINAEDAQEEEAKQEVPVEPKQEAAETPQDKVSEQPPTSQPNTQGAESGRASSEQPNQAQPPQSAPDPAPKSEGQGTVSPYRRNSRPWQLWNYMSEGPFRSYEEMKVFMETHAGSQVHYIDKVKARASEMGILETDGDKVRII